MSEPAIPERPSEAERYATMVLDLQAKVAEQAATIAELEEFKKSVLDNCTGCGYSLFLPKVQYPNCKPEI